MTELKTIIGDILTPVVDKNISTVVCHQVNCKGVMGAGLAKQIRIKFPSVYANYLNKCHLIENGIGGLGDVQFCPILSDAGFIVANIFGQDGYGRNGCFTDYDALRVAFTKIAQEFPDATIRIPYLMSCGLAGGDWNTVTNIINETLITKGVNVEIWMLPKLAKH